MSIEKAKEAILAFKESNESVLKMNHPFSRKERQAIHTFVEEQELFSKSRTCPGTNIRLMVIQKKPFEETLEISPDLKEFFLRYTGYSMPNTEFFDDYLKTLDLYLPASEQWKLFIQDFKTYFKGNLSLLKQEIATVTAKVKEAFDTSLEVTEFKEKPITSKGGKLDSLYNRTRVGKFFVSVDIRQANFTILKRETKDFLKDTTWKEFLERFTRSSFLLNSKYFREHLFGNCRITDRTVKLSYEHLQKVKEEVLDRIPYLKEATEIVYQKGDEIVYQMPDDASEAKTYSRKIQDELEKRHPELKVTFFQLEQIGTQDFYVKEFYYPGTGRMVGHDFKKIPNTFITQAIKHYFRIEIQNVDLQFIYQGMLAKFEKSIFEVGHS